MVLIDIARTTPISLMGIFDADVVYGEPLNREDLIVVPLLSAREGDAVPPAPASVGYGRTHNLRYN
ncbi:hypothetical protein GFL86_13660 [Rhizobium laguerreae]|nr:hypothetical protein [Rhizobium laguerreae]